MGKTVNRSSANRTEKGRFYFHMLKFCSIGWRRRKTTVLHHKTIARFEWLLRVTLFNDFIPLHARRAPGSKILLVQLKNQYANLVTCFIIQWLTDSLVDCLAAVSLMLFSETDGLFFKRIVIYVSVYRTCLMLRPTSRPHYEISP